MNIKINFKSLEEEERGKILLFIYFLIEWCSNRIILEKSEVIYKSFIISKIEIYKVNENLMKFLDILK